MIAVNDTTNEPLIGPVSHPVGLPIPSSKTRSSFDVFSGTPARVRNQLRK